MSAAISVHFHGDLTPSEVSAYYAVRLPQLSQRGREWRCPCPIHNGKNDNFSVEAETGLWFCHSKCGRGGSVYDLEMALSNTDFLAAANEVRRIVGRPVVRQIENRPALKWGLPGWSHGYLREGREWQVLPTFQCCLNPCPAGNQHQQDYGGKYRMAGGHVHWVCGVRCRG